MRKTHVLAVLTVILAASVLTCSTSTTTHPNRFWAEFSPSYANFQRYYDENLDSLDPIEGIWMRPDAQFAFVRSNVFEGFDYVGVALESFRQATASYVRGEIFIALRNAPGDQTYEFACASALRGEACRSLPCDGAVVIAGGTMRAQSGLMMSGECTPDNWQKRHPRR